jgi:hypothetical protein
MGLGFSLEAAEGLCVICEFVTEGLQGYLPTELQVFRFVNDTHSATANLPKDAVMGNGFPHGLGPSRHLPEWQFVAETSSNNCACSSAGLAVRNAATNFRAVVSCANCCYGVAAIAVNFPTLPGRGSVWR